MDFCGAWWNAVTVLSCTLCASQHELPCKALATASNFGLLALLDGRVQRYAYVLVQCHMAVFPKQQQHCCAVHTAGGRRTAAAILARLRTAVSCHVRRP